MNYFKINDSSYDVLVTAIEENFNILYSQNTGRVIAEGAPMVLDPLGTFYGNKVSVRRKRGKEIEFDYLYNIVSKPRIVIEPEDALMFEIAHGQETIKYRGYVGSGSRAVKKIGEDGTVYWDELSLNIVPIEAQVLPE
jgi:hypothetical protein